MPPRKRLGALAVAVGLTLLGQTATPVSATADPADATTPLDRLRVVTTQVAAGLDRPTAVTSAGDGSGRLFIAEKPGTVRAYHPGTGLAAHPLLDIGDRVTNTGNEQGLLDVVPSPDFATDHAVYVTYTSLPDGTVTLSRFTLGSDAAASEEVLLRQPHGEFTNHNGGNLEFGPDDYLYLGLGDGGGAGDPLRSGQDLSTLLGKILRIDVGGRCGDRPYCVPESNPFTDVPGARSEIWSSGLRNPWKFSFDSARGSLWIADVGQGSYEEINHVPADAGGRNFGWSCREGPEVFDASRCDPDADYVDPVLSYRTSIDGCAVIGGRVYRGQRHSELAGGTYLANDYCSGTVWGVRPAEDGEGHRTAEVGTLPTQVTAYGADESGELYVVNDLPGRLYRVSFTAAEVASR